MAVLRALGSDCSGYLGKTFVLPQCDARGQGFLWPSCVHLALTAPPILEKLSSCHSAMLTSPYLSRSCLVVVMVLPLLLLLVVSAYLGNNFRPATVRG